MKVDRLVSIIMILLDKKRISAQELADMFEVSPRTIYRDIDAICMAGIPIRSTSGVGGGFEIMPNYKIDKNVFKEADLTTLLMGLSSLSNVVHGDELVHTLAKVKSFIPADRAKDIEVKANQIYIDLSPWMSNRNIQPYMETIQTALQEDRLLTLSYIDHHGNQSKRTVEPYQLVSKNSHWYFQGYCYLRSDFRLFRLSRILSLYMEEDTFIPREYQKPQLEIDEIIAPMQKTIILRIHISIMDRVLDYCAYEQFSLEDESHYIVKFPFIEKDYYYDMLLSFGNKCECLGPPHIREEFRRRIMALASIYEV